MKKLLFFAKLVLFWGMINCLLHSSFIWAESANRPNFVIEVGKILDETPVRGPKPDWHTNAFTVAMRFQPIEPGSIPTSGNGMLFLVGSGWFEGFRAYYDYSKDRLIHFQLGRAKERTGIEAVSHSAAAFGVLNDLVCTYDGQKMRLYLNGELEAETEYQEGLSKVDSVLSVGSGSYGVGSVKMFVDRVEYWNTALDEKFVIDRFANHPPEEKKKIALWKNFKFSDRLSDFTIPISDLEKMVQMSEGQYALQESLLDRCAVSGNWEKGLPLLMKMTRDFLNRPVKNDENQVNENTRISDIFTILHAWQKVPESLLKSGDTLALKKEFFEKTANEQKILSKIHSIDTLLTERTAKIESETVTNRKALNTQIQKQISTTKKLWLSPNGCDENPGTQKYPFQSLKKALEIASSIQEKGTSVEILVEDGIYRCRETAEIIRDSANLENKAFIYVHPVSGAKPVFTFGQDLRGFSPVRDSAILRRLQVDIREKVIGASLLRNGITDYGSLGPRGYSVHDEMAPWTDLYFDGKPLEMARYPNRGEDDLQIGEVIPGPGATEKDLKSGTFIFDDPHVNTWEWLPHDSNDPIGNDIWVYGIWMHEWASRTVPVTKFDSDKKLLTAAVNTNGRFTFHFLNVLEELDQPGEYYLDRKNGFVYLIPPEGTEWPKVQIEFPLFALPFVNLRNAQNIVFEGLTFTCSRGTAFWFDGCESVYFEDGEVSQCGVHAFVINGGHDCGVYGSEIRSVGSCGVRLTGGNRDTLEPSRHFVTNCLIHDFCRIDRSYAPAVHAHGVGMVFTNNLIFDSPHHAFRTEGNDLLIARNEVHSVVYDFSDQSGIDIYCDPTYRGIVINENFWHHIGSKLDLCGQAGIRLDDSISEVLMRGNIFYRSAGGRFGGIQIHGGKDNLVTENLFLNCKTGISFNAWHSNRYRETFLRNMFPQHIAPYQKMGIYPFMDEIEENINRNYILKNEFADCSSFVRGCLACQLWAENRQIAVPSKLPLRENGLASPQTLRHWIETFPGRSLKNVGIQPSPLFPKGQAGIEHSITPYYFQEEKKLAE